MLICDALVLILGDRGLKSMLNENNANNKMYSKILKFKCSNV